MPCCCVPCEYSPIESCPFFKNVGTKCVPYITIAVLLSFLYGQEPNNLSCCTQPFFQIQLVSFCHASPLPYYLHTLTFPCQAPHNISPSPVLEQLHFCQWASLQQSWKWILQNTSRKEEPFSLALSYMELQKATDFEWGQISKAAAFYPILPEEASKTHS